MVSLDMRGLNRVLWVNAEDGVAMIEAGITGMDLKKLGLSWKSHSIPALCVYRRIYIYYNDIYCIQCMSCNQSNISSEFIRLVDSF